MINKKNQINGIYFRIKILLVLFLICAQTASLAQAKSAIPKLWTRVTDLTNTLSETELTSLENKLETFEKAKGSQIAILLIATTGRETIEQYSIRVADEWKVGRKNIDDGIIIIVAKEDRAVRIEVGYGLEGAVPDAKAKTIIDRFFIPHFKSGNFYAGLDQGVDALIGLINKEELPAPNVEIGDSLSNEAALVLFIVYIIGSILKLIIGRFFGSLIGAGLAFIVAAIALNFVDAVFLSFFMFIMLLLGIKAFFMGGRGGGGSSRSGGFRGGGGRFGGGGASGRW